MREITGLDTADYLLIFQQIDFFAPFSDAERKALIGGHTHVVAYEVGESLIQEGSAKERSLFILLSGGASVVKQGALIPLAALAPGDFFGEVSFLTSRVRTTNVIVHPASAAPADAETETIPNFFALGLPAEMRHATATVLRIDPDLMLQLDATLRIKIKDQIIKHLAWRVDVMHDKVVRATGQDPMLAVDPELDTALHDGHHAVAERERIKDRLIEQLAEFLDDLNHRLVAY